jgi:hypothetical protein
MYSGHLCEQSNRSDWQEAIVLTDMETDDLIDISLCRITMSVVPLQRGVNAYATVPTSYGYGDIPNNSPVLTGSTDTGEITLPELGTFMWTFPADRMGGVCAGAYQVGVRISQDDRTMQLIVGSVAIVEGIDMQ